MILPCPIVDHYYYGGSQDWFVDSWAKMAGCASVCATNVYCFYEGKKNYSKDDYLAIQNQMFQQLLPGKQGYPYLYSYARVMSRILQKSYIMIRNPGYHQGMTYIKSAIESQNPISLLILRHTSRKLKDDTWHWMTIFGYDERYIYYSSYGEKKKIKAKVLLRKHRFHCLKMVYFVEKNHSELEIK